MKERGGEAEEPSTTNSLKHTTDIKDSEIERMRAEKNTVIKEWRQKSNAAGGEKVPKSVGDLQGVPRLNVNPSKDNVFYDMMAYCDCNWMEDINIGNKL